MPSLSTTVGKVLEICSRTDASPNELNKVISLDPVLTGHVLKLINSAYYSMVCKVTSLPRAITMLGMNTVKNMALSTAIIQTVAGSGHSKPPLPTVKFWAHSIGVGVSAKLLAKASGIALQELEEFFIAGLLHDLGKIPFGDDYRKVLMVAREQQRPLLEVEQQFFGIDHQEVGAMIAAKWRLQGFLASCLSGHHSVELMADEDRVKMAIVSLANMYINIHDIGYAGDSFPAYRNAERLLELTRLGWPDLTALGGVVDMEIQKAQIFLQV